LQLPDPLNIYFDIILIRKYKRSDLQINWHENFTKLSQERKQIEDQFWESYIKKNPNSQIFNGTLCQLTNYNFSSSRIVLILAPIKYKTHFLYMKKGKLVSENSHFPQMGLGVSTVVLTTDDQILFMKRSQEIAANPGQFDVFGGHIDPERHESLQGGDGLLPDPFVAISTELKEELNLKSEQITDLIGLGLITNKITGQYELIFQCTTNYSTDEIINQAKKAQDKAEYSHIIRIPNNLEKIYLICLKYASDFSPSGLASLWLHYLSEKEKTLASADRCERN